MLPSRFVTGQPSAVRKSRLEGKPSLLPLPRRPGSTDRLSVEARRPSTTGHRSSSAEPRGTFGGSRQSREMSTTKVPLNGRSRSQQGDKYGQSMTPLRSSQYSLRPTNTPVRTPSEDRTKRSWQACLERALSYVAVKDTRPISNATWIRAEIARVGEALAMRGSGGGGSVALMRPLSIARFVDIVRTLLTTILKDLKLNTDNYVDRLPSLAKRLLYPGTVSKSWLKTVNTLHAFPQALAFISYLLDMVEHIETPVPDECMYVEKDELACLRRDYLKQCWSRFQEPEPQYEDLNEEYLKQLTVLLGNDEKKIMELQEETKRYQALLEDESEASARADEAKRAERRAALLQALRTARAQRSHLALTYNEQKGVKNDLAGAMRQVDHDIERAKCENQQLRAELERQPLSVGERTRLLDEVDYARRVLDSKRVLADQIGKMVVGKESELAVWQRAALESCVEYKQGLIHLTAHYPQLAPLNVDEKELMGEECVGWVSRAVEVLRDTANMLAEQRAEHARSKSTLARKRAALLEETRAKIGEMKSSIRREQDALDNELAADNNEISSWSSEVVSLRARLEELGKLQLQYAEMDFELDYWTHVDNTLRSQVSKMQEQLAAQREESARRVGERRARCERGALLAVGHWRAQLRRLCNAPDN